MIDSSKRNPLKSNARNLLFATICVGFIGLVGLIAIEVVLRAREASHSLPLFQANPLSAGSYRLVPGLEADRQVDGETVKIRVNDQALHWRTVTEAKAEGDTRVAFVGDSFTFGCWALDYKHSFVGVFDSQSKARQIEAVNFGVGGYGLDDVELMVQERVLNFQPDWVVLAFFNGNDFRDTHLGPEKYILERGVVEYDPANIIELVPEAHRPALTQNTRPLAILRFFDRAVAKLKQRSNYAAASTGVQTADGKVGSFVPETSFSSFTFWSSVPPPPVITEAVDTTLARVESIRELLESKGIKFAILCLPFREQVYAGEVTGSGYDIGLPQRYLQEYGQSKGVPIGDPLPDLRKYVETNPGKLYVTGDPHFNTAGHDWVGKWVANWFAGLLEGEEAN
jgi:hypothetical protein